MPAFNFQKQFAADVESGKKHQTIRAKRKDGQRPMIGQTAYLYTGMRHSSCRKLGEHPITNVQDLFISEKEVLLEMFGVPTPMGSWELEKIALADGFENRRELLRYIKETYGLPFEGDLIKWSRL